MNKSIRILLIVFAVLVAVYFLFLRSGEKDSTEKIKPKLFVADSSKIDKIEIARNNETIVFEKVNNVWKITKPVDYPADTFSVYNMLGNLQNFEVENVVSNKTENFNKFLDSANNPKISTYQEGKLLGTFEMGKTLNADKTYIKKPDENTILLVSKLISTNFTKQLKDYRVKTITSFNTFLINKMQFKSTDSNKVDFTAVKDSTNRWRIDGDTVAATTMDQFLNMLAAFSTEDFKDTTITTFPVPTYTITLSGPNLQNVINFYKEEGSTPPSFICQVSGINQLFLFHDATAGQLMKKKKDFIPEPPKK